MEIKINDYTISIKARYNYRQQKKYNKEDTLTFINWLSFAFYQAAIHQDALTCYAIAEDLRKTAQELYNICKENKLYNKK